MMNKVNHLKKATCSVCNFQSMKSPVEQTVISSGLLCHLSRRDTGRLGNQAFTSNHVVSSKQWLGVLKITGAFA